MKLLTSKARNRAVLFILGMGVVVTVLTTLSVLGLLGKETISFCEFVSFKEFFLGTRWEPLLVPKSFGIWPLVSGTMMVAVGAIAIAVPSGILAAVYLSEYANGKTRSWLKPALEVLAGVPTVVYGYFALSFITPMLKQWVPGLQIFNALSGAIVVAIMVLPMIASLTDDALQALPKSLKEKSEERR